MERKLSNIFKTNSREARKAILDKFDITKENKQEVLNRIGNSGGEGGKARYFKVYDDINPSSYQAAGLQYLLYYNCFTLKVINSQNNLVITQGFNSLYVIDCKSIIGFSFTPGIVSIFDNHDNVDERKTIACKYCSTIEEFIELARLGNGQGSSVVDPTVYIEKEITEEEYCSLPLPTVNIAFDHRVYKEEDIQDAEYIIRTYEYERGMTFDEWFNSKYNVDNIKPFTVDGQIEQGKVVAPFLTYDANYGCTIYGYTGVGIEFKYPMEGYFYDKNVYTPNGKETCQLVITG